VENSSFFVLKSSKDFERLKLKGSKVFLEKKILVCYLINDLDHHRVGWTLPRAVGNAVLRNRLKRYSREFFRTQNHIISKSKLDVNLVFLKSGSIHFKKMDYNDFKKLLLPCWQKITNVQ
jgi:ribonuclease P protein component